MVAAAEEVYRLSGTAPAISFRVSACGGSAVQGGNDVTEKIRKRWRSLSPFSKWIVLPALVIGAAVALRVVADPPGDDQDADGMSDLYESRAAADQRG